MKNVFNISVLLFLTLGCSAQTSELLSPEQFKTQIAEESGSFKILDLRTDEEVAEGKVPGAGQLDFYDDEFELKLEDLNKQTTYYIYCRSGGRSGKTRNKMKELGFQKVYEMQGGMNAWKAKGLEME